ncbi:MAG: addiction module protein [Bacteroidia bacterium]|nr:addiction module protein [Bacteroidia bacterium]
MKNKAIYERIERLPEKEQEDLLAQIEFLLAEIEDPQEFELTEYGKQFLDERLKRARENPESMMTIEELDEHLSKKFG